MKFKTEICKFWQNTGTCEYSDSCSFAHGSHELKQRQDQPRNYKTKQCKRFHKELYCPYGPRCQFLHDEPGSLKKAKAVEITALDSNNAVVANDESVASVSYTHLLNNVTEQQTGLTECISGETAVILDMPACAPAALDFAKVLQPLEADVATSSRRLRVFEDMPVSRSNSQLSLE